jgi:hypothetical protein
MDSCCALIASGEVRFSVEDFEHTVSSVSFSPDGSKLLAIEYNGRPRVYDTKTGELISVLQQQCPGYGKGFEGYQRFGAFVEGGRVVCACDVGAIELCDLSNGACQVLVELNDSHLSAMSADADGRHILLLEVGQAGPVVVRREVESGIAVGRYKFQ